MDDNPRKIHPIDAYVGTRVRRRRQMLGYSQNELGSKLGITFQQVQKYEKGTNRIGASRLYEIAIALNVSVLYFYENMEAPSQANIEDQQSDESVSASQSSKLHRYFSNIQDEEVRKTLLEFIKAASSDNKQ